MMAKGIEEKIKGFEIYKFRIKYESYSLLVSNESDFSLDPVFEMV